MSALPPDRLDDEVDRRFQGGVAQRVLVAVAEHAVGTERLRRRPLLRPARRDEDLARPAGACRDDGREADRARAEHQHPLAHRQAGDPHAVDGDAERLRQRGGREGRRRPERGSSGAPGCRMKSAKPPGIVIPTIPIDAQ